jgi:hypothetical protein
MYKNNRGFMKDMNRADLLKMREGGMSNAAIAVSLGCSKTTVYQLIGKQPPEISKRNKELGYIAMRKENREKPTEEGYTVQRKAPSMMPRREEAPVKAVLAVRKSAIQLAGAFSNYTISPDRTLIDVEDASGRVLYQFQADKLDTFIAELTAIQRNIGQAQPMEMWG